MNYNPPFFVKLNKPDSAFTDFESRFHITGNSVKEIHVVTPLIRQWLMNGGLLVCDENGVSAELIFVKGRDVKTKTVGIGQGPSQPEKPASKQSKTKTPPTPESDGEGDGEQSLEDLLNQEVK